MVNFEEVFALNKPLATQSKRLISTFLAKQLDSQAKFA